MDKNYKYKRNKSAADIKEYLLQNYINVNDCWVSTLAKDKDGYALTKINGKQMRVHRLAYELFNGALDEELQICHTCDNPPCFNPQHLFMGTNLDNIADRHRKSRNACGNDNGAYTQPQQRRKGSLNGQSILSEQQVVEIRAFRQYFNAKELSERYGVTKITIYKILSREIWKHL